MYQRPKGDVDRRSFCATALELSACVLPLRADTAVNTPHAPTVTVR